MEPLDVGDASDALRLHLAGAQEEKPGPSLPLAVEDGGDEKREDKSHPTDGTEFRERDEGVDVSAEGTDDPEQRIYESAAGDAAVADGFEEGDVGAATGEAKGSVKEDDEGGDCDGDGGGEKAPVLAPFSLDDLDFAGIEVDDVVICEKATADDSDEAIGGDAAEGEAMGEEAGVDADDVLSEEAGADAGADDVLREEAAGDADADDVLKEEAPADSDYVLEEEITAAAIADDDNLLREEAAADDDAEDVLREEAATGNNDDVFRGEAAADDTEDVLREEGRAAAAADDKLSRDEAAANDDDAEDVLRDEAAAHDAEDVLREEAAAADDNDDKDDDDDVLREEADNDEVAVEEPATEFMDEEYSQMATEEAMHDALQETEPVMDARRVGGGKRKRGRPSSVEEMEEEQEEAPVFEPLGGEETRMASEEEEPMAETASGSSGKRKRGRPPKSQVAKVMPRRMAKSQVARAPVKRKEEEEVCFICFDGGDLVVCDRRGCPKVYHPACVNRDESFFRSKGRWNCGWHICSLCQKSAHFMCYTCTYSLCKGCIKEAAGFICVRGNKGLCETCLSTVMLIEKDDHVAVGVDFDDRNSWMHMFKEYWLQLKGKLSLTFEELDMARTSRKGSNVSGHNVESSDELYNAENDHGASSDSSLGRRGGKLSSRKKMKKHSRRSTNEASVKVGNAVTSAPEDIEWASKELLELVAHMRDGDRSLLSQFDVQNLLLDYIKRNNLRDPRRKSHIICDPMLQNLFGKPRVGHFEMLKLLESHFLVKESSQLVTDDSQGGVVDPDSSQVDAERNSDASTKMSSDKKRKTRKRFERELQYNLDDYAAIDVHNINLMYLRRNLMEDLIDDVEGFYEKVVGSFVRIRISGSGQRQDMYRLVQVIGTRNAAEKYKTGKKMTDILLEILNLNKTEVITIDIISNQEFTEEECKRLRQSIKCGLIGRLTVGEVQEKAMLLQAVRVNDWLENEKSRLGHLRDRASEQGRRKQLRECVEKLQLLSTPEERIRRLNEVPEIHADPNMDPDYESAEDEVEPDDKKGESYDKQIEVSSFKKGMEVTSPGKGGSFQSNSSNNLRKSLNRNTLAEGTRDRFDSFIQSDGKNGTSPSQGKDGFQVNPTGLEASVWNAGQPGTKPAQSSGIPQATSTPSTGVTLPSGVSETEKIWHYQDPSGKIQGPFSMTQLRKWDTTGYFPPTLKIWRASESQEASILLADALIGKFQSYLPQPEPQHHSFPQSTNTSSMIGSGQNNSDGSHRENNWRGNNISTFTESGLSGATWSGQNNVGISAWSSDGKDCSDVKAGSYTQAWSPISAPKQEPHSLGLHSAPGVSAWQENQPQKLESSLPGAEHVKSGNQEVVSNIDRERSMPSPTPSANPTPAANLSGFDGGIISDYNQNSQFHSSHNSRSLASSEEGVSASTEPAPQSNSGWGLVPQNVNSVTVQSQGNGNLGWGSAVQANASAGWGTVVPGNTNVAWGIPAQGNANVNLGFVAPAQANSTVNPGWTAPAQGNTNVNMGWVAPTQGNMSEQVNATLNPNWGALPQGNLNPPSGNMPQNINWAASLQTASNANPGWGTRQANVNQPWDPSAGNHNGWNSKHLQKEDGNSFQGERSFHGNDSGHGSGRHSWNRMHSSGGGSSWTPRGGPAGVCKFHESGYCKKGANCNYVHL